MEKATSDLFTGYARSETPALAALLAGAQQNPHDVDGFIKEFFTYAGQNATVADLPAAVLASASDGIAIAAKTLRKEGYRTIGVINPAGSFIHNMLRDEGLKTTRIAENDLYQNPQNLPQDIDALYLVLPNNPSGVFPDRMAFAALLKIANDRDIPVVLDFCFRFYSPLHTWDQYKTLMESGVRFFAIEDTGKSFAAHGMKAGMLICRSEDGAGIAALVARAPSPATISVLTALLKNSGATPEDLPMRIAANRNRAVLESSGLFTVRSGGAAPFAEIAVADWPESWQSAAMDNAGINLMKLKDFYGEGGPAGLRVPLAFSPLMFDRFIAHARATKAQVDATLQDHHRAFVKRF